MLTGQNIVCFSPDPSWHHLWRNRHQIMTRLARRNRVLFVEPTPYLRPVWDQVRREGWRALGASTFFSPMPNLWVYRSPNAFPISGKWPLRPLTFALRRRHLRATLRRLGMERPILWVFRYDLGEMIGHLDEQLVIYHAVDEYAGYVRQEEDARRIQALERQVMARAQLVFVTSHTLLQSKRAWHSDIYHVPNGVDYPHFATPPAHFPSDVTSIPRPRIGYVGAINEKLDIELLDFLAVQRPDWHLVLVGPVLFKHPQVLETLTSRPNVHFLGRKSVDELPAYMHALDVCLMPYAHNLWTENINPLKLYEYLATGRPIISTGIPAVQDFQDVVRIEDNREAFLQAVAHALTHDTLAERERRQARARENTWDRRVATLSSIIQGYLVPSSSPSSRNHGEPASLLT